MRQRILEKRRAVFWGALWGMLLLCASLVWGASGWQSGRATASDDYKAYVPLLRTSAPPANAIALQVVATDLSTHTVTDIVFPVNDDRLFLVYREGVIDVVQNDVVLPAHFLDISGEVGTFNWEEGLMGLAFHPQYAQNRFFFVAYTAAETKKITIARYQTSADNPNVADPASRQILMAIPKPLDEYSNEPSPVHNGGDLQFGPDGYLYITTGDGGPDPYLGSGVPGDPNNHAQRLDVLLGKILRIDVNQAGGLPPDCGAAHYAIPADNPFVDGNSGDGDEACDEIWALGLRNPWRFSFDSATGDMYIGDVGEWQREEIDFQAAGVGGLNYGWHCFEGELDYSQKYPDEIECEENVSYMAPLLTYSHVPDRCSVIGGSVYRGEAFPTLYGQYLYADFCSGQIWRYSTVHPVGEVAVIGDFPVFWTVIAPGADGELYASGFFIEGQTGPPTLFRLIVP